MAASDAIFPISNGNGAMQCLSITVIEDTALEGEETFLVTLTTSNPVVMLGNTEAVVTIEDNDGQ